MTCILCAALLAVLATTGCLSMGILHESRGPSSPRRTITGVTGASLVGDRLIIGLDIARQGMRFSEHVEAKIPLRDLDWERDHPAPGTPDIPGIVFARPSGLDLRRSSSTQEKGVPIKVEPFDLKRLQDIASLRDTLPPGLHVLSLRSPATVDRPARSIPALIDTREGQVPYGLVLTELPDARSHKKLLLLLLPVAAPIDTVTFPLQIVAAILIGDC